LSNFVSKGITEPQIDEKERDRKWGKEMGKKWYGIISPIDGARK